MGKQLAKEQIGQTKMENKNANKKGKQKGGTGEHNGKKGSILGA